MPKAPSEGNVLSVGMGEDGKIWAVTSTGNAFKRNAV
jgi:hypothetical protein